jgi:hypothetical protein
MNKTRILAIYLLALGILQSVLYLVWWQTGDRYLFLFYFDPRIGIFCLETAVTGTEQSLPSALRIVSAAWLVGIGSYLLGTGSGLKVYIASELLLGASTVLFMLLIVVANISATHGFSVGELMIPFPLFLIYTVAPLIIALRYLK